MLIIFIIASIAVELIFGLLKLADERGVGVEDSPVIVGAVIKG